MVKLDHPCFKAEVASLHCSKPSTSYLSDRQSLRTASWAHPTYYLPDLLPPSLPHSTPAAQLAPPSSSSSFSRSKQRQGLRPFPAAKNALSKLAHPLLSSRSVFRCHLLREALGSRMRRHTLPGSTLPTPSALLSLPPQHPPSLVRYTCSSAYCPPHDRNRRHRLTSSALSLPPQGLRQCLAQQGFISTF